MDSHNHVSFFGQGADNHYDASEFSHFDLWKWENGEDIDRVG
jgi:hypothetical protein